MPSSKQARLIHAKLPANCTERDLNRLRQTIPNSHIRFMAWHRTSSGWAVLAQGKDKFTPKRWRLLLHPGLFDVTPLQDIKPVVESMRKVEGFEEIGAFTFCKPRSPRRDHDPVPHPDEAGEQDDPLASKYHAQNSMYATARRVYDETAKRTSQFDPRNFPLAPSDRQPGGDPCRQPGETAMANIRHLHHTGIAMARQAALDYIEYLRKADTFLPDMVVAPAPAHGWGQAP
jgi:hypothetical protein